MDPMKKKAIQYTITFIGQIIIIILYTAMGAAVFKAIELPHEEQRREQLVEDTRGNRTKMVARIQNITEQYYDTDRDLWRRRITWLVTNMEKRMGLDVKEFERDDERNWSFAGALFFSATVITTIGYGHIAPVTTAGRIFCMAYAIFGISLLLLVLASIGSLLARGATLTYRMLHDKIGAITIGKRKKKPEEDSMHGAYMRQNSAYAAQEQQRDKVIDDIWGTIRFDKDGKMIMPDDSTSRTTLSSQSNGNPSSRKGSKDTSKLRVNFADGKKSNDDPEEGDSRVVTPQGMYLPPEPTMNYLSGTSSEPVESEHSIGFGMMDDDIDEDEVVVPLHVVFLLAAIYIVLLAGTLLLWEDQWDFFDALYFSFVTLTTIGFGDLVPEHQKNLLACTFLIILGMAIISMCIALAQDLIMRKIAWLSQKVGVALLRSSKGDEK